MIDNRTIANEPPHSKGAIVSIDYALYFFYASVKLRYSENRVRVFVTDKEAAEKKRPARRPLDVECSLDVGVPAVFYCKRCNKPFCEDCIGREAGKKTLCIHCTSVEESIEDETRQKRGFDFAKKKKPLLILLAVVASILIAFNAYVLYNDHLESDQTEAVEHEVSLQLMGIVECRANLEELAAEALSYSKMLERPPSSIEELSSILGAQVNTEDPISFEPYIIKSDDEGNITAHCPTPKAHGVGSITASPGSPARVSYTNERGQP